LAIIAPPVTFPDGMGAVKNLCMVRSLRVGYLRKTYKAWRCACRGGIRPDNWRRRRRKRIIHPPPLHVAARITTNGVPLLSVSAAKDPNDHR